MPRRSAQGIDTNRLAMLIAVLERSSDHRFFQKDVYASVVGGVKLAEPAGDLGVALALASTSSQQQVPADIVAIGEVGLGGELRRVGQMDRRLAEAARLGFTRAIVPAATPEVPGIQLMRMATLGDAVKGFKVPSSGS
jgi:DNA repair protein RadA/Sms